MVTGSSNQYTCELCKKKFPFGTIRYSRDGKRIICVDCYESIKNDDKQQKTRIELVSPPQSSTTTKYICVNCRYKFTLKNDALNRKCPYCGKGNIMKNEELSAENILDQLSRAEERRKSR